MIRHSSVELSHRAADVEVRLESDRTTFTNIKADLLVAVVRALGREAATAHWLAHRTLPPSQQ